MITSFTSIFKLKFKLGYFATNLGLKIGFNTKKNAYTMNFWEGINGELLKASASECKSFLYFLKILKKKTSRIWGRGGRIHTLYSTPFARLVVKSEGWGGGWLFFSRSLTHCVIHKLTVSNFT